MPLAMALSLWNAVAPAASPLAGLLTYGVREAYRQGRARLALDDGSAFDVAIVAHAKGSPSACFESHEASGL